MCAIGNNKGVWLHDVTLPYSVKNDLITSVSYYKYPTKEQAIAWNTQYPELTANLPMRPTLRMLHDQKKNIFRVTVYYDTLSFTLSEEKAFMSLPDVKSTMRIELGTADMSTRCCLT